MFLQQTVKKNYAKHHINIFMDGVIVPVDIVYGPLVAVDFLANALILEMVDNKWQLGVTAKYDLQKCKEEACQRLLTPVAPYEQIGRVRIEKFLPRFTINFSCGYTGCGVQTGSDPFCSQHICKCCRQEKSLPLDQICLSCKCQNGECKELAKDSFHFCEKHLCVSCLEGCEVEDYNMCKECENLMSSDSEKECI